MAHCSVGGCTRLAHSRGFCNAHYLRLRNHGSVHAKLTREGETWEPIIEGNVAKIPLTQGLFATVDLDDLPKVIGKNWYAAKGKHTFYALRDGQKMHRLLAAVPDGQVVDHKDGDGLNNRRENLRICNTIHNTWNQRLRRDNLSGFKGVQFHRTTGKWRARIRVLGKLISLGLHEDKVAAAKAYNRAAVEHFGEFARLNELPC